MQVDVDNITGGVNHYKQGQVSLVREDLDGLITAGVELSMITSQPQKSFMVATWRMMCQILIPRSIL